MGRDRRFAPDEEEEYAEVVDGTGRVIATRPTGRRRKPPPPEAGVQVRMDPKPEPEDGGVVDYLASQPPRPVVGEPCPEEIALDQGADRCPFMGESLNNYWCSRPAEHDGPHVATEGDAPGAEVLAARGE
jgi:hypothetical protein